MGTFKWGLFCREFYTDFTGFYQIQKFQVVFEISPEMCAKYAIFEPPKCPILDLKWGFSGIQWFKLSLI